MLNGTFNTAKITTRFGSDWVDRDSCYGLIKKHVGIDYTDSSYAYAGAVVKAADSGYVKVAKLDPQWGGYVVIEHHQCWTTVYWHVIPKVSQGSYVTQGQQIGTVANLTQISGGRYGTHLHFGFRAKPYNDPISKAGALPQKACSPYPASPEYFVNPAGIAWF